MKLAVICANGRAGRLITKEAVDRGLDVTAIARGENKTAARHFIKKDLFDLTKDDLAPFDVVVDAFGAWSEDTAVNHVTSLQHLCDLLSQTNKRLLVVGGAGSLYVNPEHTLSLSQTPDFPESFLPVASAMAKGLADLRKCDDVKWTYLSPAADFQADGLKTGKYILGNEEMIVNDKGKSAISYADYATAMVDEILEGTHFNERISVIGV